MILDDASATTQGCGQVYRKQPTPICSSAKGNRGVLSIWSKNTPLPCDILLACGISLMLRNSLEEREVAGKALCVAPRGVEPLFPG